MKEVKAYVRRRQVESVIDNLEEAGVKGITLIDLMGLGSFADPHQMKYSISCVEKYSDISKLELVCRDDQVHEIVRIIRETAFTGLKGDGIIYVSPVDMAVKIRTGAIGESGL
jgi:nitrogen regulatory protein P-II 1